MIRAGLPPRHLVLGSNFVDDPGARPGAPSRSGSVLFVGRISPEKGLHVLLDAWSRATVPGLHLDVVGDGPDRVRLERDKPPGVTFLGRRPSDEVMCRLQWARALVVPSIWHEGQPVTALEGMAAGTPVVLSDIGGLPEVLGGQAAGWVTAPNRSNALARTLEQLADDAAVDDRGGRARRRYLDKFTPAAAVARLEAVYADAGDGWRS